MERSDSSVPDRRPPTADFRARHRVPAQAFVITLVGRFQSVKNHALLIDAFARVMREVPSARLVLAGSGPLRGEIESRCQRSEIRDRVVFLDEVRHADLPAVYQAADVNVISSDYESFCFAVLEGMASGLPHVVTGTNWVPWLIGGKKADEREADAYASGITRVPGGYVTPVGDAAAFAEALLALYREPEQRAAMGQWARERAVRDFSWQASARQLLGVYDTLVTKA